jgi:carbon starvation protein
MKRLMWVAIAGGAAVCLGAIASSRGETINSIWLVLAAVCSYLLAYRFYGKFIAAQVMTLDETRATPAERLENGHDYVPTNKWIVFGHHFAAIAGPGPLVGPVLAAQFGYLPGTLWIIAGAVLGGAVQDFVILFASMRRDGKSLGQMAREEIGKVGGFVALITVLLIMVILLAVVGLVVVNALAGSPWEHSRSRQRCRWRCSWDSTCGTGGRARCWNARPSDLRWCWRRYSGGSGLRDRPRSRRCSRFRR